LDSYRRLAPSERALSKLRRRLGGNAALNDCPCPSLNCVSREEADDRQKLQRRHLSGAGILIQAEKGWFLARAVDGKANVETVAAADIGPDVLRDLQGAGFLIEDRKRLFVHVETPLSEAKVKIRDKE
jgi:hypothetical protein